LNEHQRTRLQAADFEPAVVERRPQKISRPSLSYWQDAWRRLKLNRRALFSLILVIGLLLFAAVGPWLWRVDPAVQDVDQISQGPSRPAVAVVTGPYTPWKGCDGLSHGKLDNGSAHRLSPTSDSPNPLTLRLFALFGDPAPGATGYSIYRSIYDPGKDRTLGLPLTEVTAEQVSFEDRLNLKPVRYWYSVVALDASGTEVRDYATSPRTQHSL
jgi:oligopeptide transport system permease protein